MSFTIAGSRHKSPPPIRPMSWLDWSQVGDEYVGGDYRIVLIEPRRWEIRYRGSHLAEDPSLQSALTVAEHHYRELLRLRDLVTWGIVLVGSLIIAGLVELTSRTIDMWAVPILAVALFAGVSAVVRIFAAATRSRFDPYRRRAPWEPHAWWKR